MKKCNSQNPCTPCTKKENSDQTRAKILKAAAKLFAEKGFSGTSLSAIAKTAKITQSLIHHHFINKEKLWNEVKHSFCTQYSEQLQPATEQCPSTLKDFLNEIVVCYFELFKHYPQTLRMRYWQRLENHVNQKKLLIDPKLNEFLQSVKNDILQLQKQGEIKSTITPEFIILAISNITQSIFDLHWFYQKDKLPQKQQEYIQFIIDSFYQALK
jgi:TetR/AcrR family transcriptional regulator